MRFKILISNEAEDQLTEAFLYYKEVSITLTQRFKDDITEVIGNISRNLNHYQNRYKNIKIALTSNFPYSIHFIVKEDTVYILKILHQKQFYK